MLPVFNRTNRFPSLWNELFRDDLFPATEWNKRASTPAINIAEDEKGYRIEVAAPGLKKEDLKINLDDNILTISYENEDKKEEKTDNYVRREFCYSEFKRSFVLPENVDAEKIEATHNNGVLNVVIPKTEEKKVTKNIAIA